IDRIPSNDFSLYDHVLDTAVMVGAIPPRFGQRGEAVDLSLYFELARGRHVPPLEMTKWFDTNYHYLVPEFHRGQEFHLANRKPLEEYLEAKALGIETVPILLGPVSFLLLGKSVDGSAPLDLLPSLLSVYKTLLNELAQAGAAWVQLDEPCLVMDRTDAEISALQTAYTQLVQAAPLKLLLATYFGSLDTHFDTVWQLPVQGIHLDLVRAPEQRQSLMGAEIIRGRWVSLGVLDGRNVWRADVSRIASDLRPVVERFGPERVILAPSCSLIHVPWDVELETEMDPELRGWLSFATQKLQELTTLKAALQGNAESLTLFVENQAALAARKNHPRVVRPEVRERVASIVRTAAPRSDRSVRKPAQQAQLRLPVLPTTTIGSFPQTEAVRQARAKFRNGQLDADAYQAFLKEQIRACIHQQEDCGLDVLVHGEFERTDMVEYFAEHLDGFLLTRHGWVQSYGSHCGDVIG
ncbi:MAG: 5-methyltetrahydropteroyltriglutamate--homocysteine S-methyltransferase, partial [Alicyclobacillus herbarius]|uniref:5-methyltetrahydropteroyltriglutamate-- homocysteine S-methyltransferase n=1 Tax=Alicyclobacillus herbarius TaxID=122960 RepID=UPI0023537F6B